MQVYQQALRADPTFKKARADWLSAKQNLPIAMTGTGVPGSGLFPFVDIAGFANRAFSKYRRGHTLIESGHFNASDYSVTITQPIFNYATWKAISRAGFQVKAATATYIAAAQDLMFRVGEVYFNVLRDYDILQIVEQKKIAILQQLVIAKRRLEIGLEAVTDVYDVKSRYYRALTEEVTARRDLEDQLENLRAITGRSYYGLAGIPEKIPLIIPKPNNIDRWVQISERQNFEIQSDLYSMLAARERIKETAAANWPTLNAEAAFETLHESKMRGEVPRNRNIFQTNEVGFTLDFPIFQGGHVYETTKQEEYNYLSASDQLEFTRYEVRKNTRQAFINIDYGIDQIITGHKAILAAKDNLKATEISYIIGTRNMVDVLGDIEQAYFVMERWANHRYDYIISLIQLKQQAGTLAPDDLAILNRWLKKTISFALARPKDESHLKRLSESTKRKLKLLNLKKRRAEFLKNQKKLPPSPYPYSPPATRTPEEINKEVEPDTTIPTDRIYTPPRPRDADNPKAPNIENPPTPNSSMLQRKMIQLKAPRNTHWLTVHLPKPSATLPPPKQWERHA